MQSNSKLQPPRTRLLPTAPMVPIGRREFLKAAAAGSIVLGAHARFATAAARSVANKFCAFTKPLQSLSFSELAATIAGIGYGGVEIAIRQNGHISPEQVDEQLPRLIDALRAHGLELTMMTSDITSMKQTNAARVLRAASRAGVKRYRLGYCQYDLSKSIPLQLAAFKSSLHEVIAASNDLGLIPVYQNHSGSTLMGAPLWDLYELVEKYNPEQVGVALDVAHLMVEGGLSWPLQYHLLRPHMSAVYVKDFVWKGHEVQWVPLGEGRVEQKIFSWIRESSFDGPMSVHVEYLDELAGPERVTNLTKAFEQDLVTLQRFMAA